jgi:hypothetical protein
MVTGKMFRRWNGIFAGGLATSTAEMNGFVAVIHGHYAVIERSLWARFSAAKNTPHI